MFKSFTYENELKTFHANEIFCVLTYDYNYALGITGSDRYLKVLADNGFGPRVGFKTKGAAREAYRQLKKEGNFKSKLKSKTPGYAALGEFYSKPEFLTGTELFAKIKENQEMSYCRRMVQFSPYSAL